MPYFAEKWLFTFLTYPTINTLIPTKCRELLERNYRETQDWLNHNLIPLILKFLYSHHFHWHTLERFISQILISPYPNQWGGILVFGKQFRDDQFIWLMQWAYCGILKAREDIVRLNQLVVGAWRAQVHWVD